MDKRSLNSDHVLNCLIFVAVCLWLLFTFCITPKFEKVLLTKEVKLERIERAMVGAKAGQDKEVLVVDAKHGTCLSGRSSWQQFLKSASCGEPCYLDITIHDDSVEIHKTISYDGKKYHLFQNAYYEIITGEWVRKPFRVSGINLLRIPEFEGYIAYSYYISDSESLPRNDLEDHFDWLKGRYVKGKGYKVITIQEDWQNTGFLR